MRDADHNGAVPAVIGADWVAEQRGDEPVLVYLPSEQVLTGDRDVTVTLVKLEDGRVVLPVFTGLDALVARLGQTQAWVSLPSDKVAEIQEQSGADEVIWDPEVPADLPEEADR